MHRDLVERAMAGDREAFTELTRQSYDVIFPKSASSGDMKQFAAARRERSVHLLLGEKITSGKVKRVVALAATVQDGMIVHMRRVHSR